MTPHDRRRRLVIRRIRITGWSALTSLLVTLVGFLTYFHIVFPADRSATLEVFRDDRVTTRTLEGVVIMEPVDAATEKGLVYFPGAKVDPYSYLYPLVDVAAAGTTIVIVDPLFNMALFDPRDVDDLIGGVPDATQWSLAGHSLGGVKACMVADHPRVSHVILFASYCANDISSLPLEVVHVLGSEDGLLDDTLVQEARALVPADSRTIVLEGVNHANFGTYGEQPGDGLSDKSYEDMRKVVGELVMEVIN
ncbi:MAG: hypothetical protein RL247_79 [Actinomycetota bacterium]